MNTFSAGALGETEDGEEEEETLSFSSFFPVFFPLFSASGRSHQQCQNQYFSGTNVGGKVVCQVGQDL